MEKLKVYKHLGISYEASVMNGSIYKQMNLEMNIELGKEEN